jgi:hypothetical protein
MSRVNSHKVNYRQQNVNNVNYIIHKQHKSRANYNKVPKEKHKNAGKKIRNNKDHVKLNTNTTTTTTNNNNNNSIFYYLCAESTATRPITDTAQYRYT